LVEDVEEIDESYLAKLENLFEALRLKRRRLLAEMKAAEDVTASA
jgi:ABC-type phosphate transport system auxiliary subunit